MNNNIKEARFRLVKYLVKETSIKLESENIEKKIQISIVPKGTFKEENKEFILTLTIFIKDEAERIKLEMSLDGTFEYDGENMKEIKSFIGKNAPAILFPYIRAYISNITALGGIPPIIIPTLNIESVGEELLKSL